MAADGEQLPDRPYRVTISQDAGRRRSWIRGRQGAGGHGHKLGHMEHWVNLENRRENQTYCNGADDTVHRVGNIPGIQLAGSGLGGLEGQFPGQQPTLLARLVDRRTHPPPVGPVLGLCSGLEQRSPGGLPDTSTDETEMGPGGWDCHLQLLLGKQRGLVTQGALERGHTSG